MSQTGSEVHALDPEVDPAHRLPVTLWWAYELLMAALALLVVWLLTMDDEGWVRAANLGIWGAFVVDYGVRLALVDDRRRFVRRNVPDLIAILPLDFFRVARLARLARLLRLLRAAVILWRVSRSLRGVLATNGLGWLLVFATVVVCLGGFAAWWAEPGFDDYGDALWWSMVTATTVGYGDLSPTTGPGRLTAAILMLVGIGTLGMITGSIATYFLSGRQRDVNPQVAWLRDQLNEWEELEVDDRHRLAAMLQGLAEADDW